MRWGIRLFTHLARWFSSSADLKFAGRANFSLVCLPCSSILAIAGLPLVCLLVGCTSWREYKANGYKVGPNYCRPAAAVAENWIDATDKRLSSDEADLSHWWTAFNDPKLNELIQTAYQQNLSLKEAGFRILEARAELAIQMGSLFPQQQQAVGAWSRNAISTLAANQQMLPDRFFNNWDLGFNLSWELDFWGRFRRAIESAQAELNASVYNYDDVVVTLLGDVASTYVTIRTLQQQIEYVRDNIKIQNESLDIAEARFRGGLTSDLDVQQAISQLAQTEALIPQFQKQVRAANDRLCVLMGMPTENLIPNIEDKPIPSVSPNVVVGIPADVLTRRVDIRPAEQIAAAQCAQIGIAEADLYPSIAITGSVGFDAQRFSRLFKDHSFQGSIGPGFQWNVLNYGRLVNNVRLQDARFHELVMTYRNTVLRANAEVEDGISEFLQSQLQAQAMQRSVTAAARAVQLAITQYRAGLVDFNRVALLEQNLVQQQDLLAQAQGDIDQGLVHTYRALGGGWEIRCQGPGDYSDQVQDVDGTLPPKVEELPPGAIPDTGTTPNKSKDKQLKSPPNMELPGPAEGMPGMQVPTMPAKPLDETPVKPSEELPGLPMDHGTLSPSNVSPPAGVPTPAVPEPGAVPAPGPVPEPGSVHKADAQPMSRRLRYMPVRQASAIEFEENSARVHPAAGNSPSPVSDRSKAPVSPTPVLRTLPVLKIKAGDGPVKSSSESRNEKNERGEEIGNGGSNATGTSHEASIPPISKPVKLRYSSDQPAITDHAQLLPQDRGDSVWWR